MSDKAPVMTMTVNSFVRYYSLDHTKLISEISRRMVSSGGYDFYRTVNEAIRAHIDGAGQDKIDYILNGSKNLSEVALNKAAFETYKDKYGNKKNIESFDRKSKLKLCGGELIIVSSPVFTIETKNDLSMYAVWSSQKPILDKAKSSVALYLTKEAFKKNLPNYNVKLFDAVSGKTFSSINNATSSDVDGVARRILEIAKTSL